MTDVFTELLKLVAIDGAFLALCFLLILPLATYKKAAYAIVKRNFVSYFMNPTGYVFLCMFVILTSLAAFWPHEFFAANLASLHQLNQYLPYIMLVFIPAITMSIWSEERRQGTDELLLTLPADDFDVVIGKYLAAAAVYTCSLLFAQLSHYMILVALSLGSMDTGLLCAAYFGYWLTGLAMIALGMVASFLTRNLTVGFILGAVFNAPLVFIEFADVILPWSGMAHTISSWSISARFDDFGRGVISLSSVTYFGAIMVVGLYLCMVLIGSRHWWGGRDGNPLIGHYLVRTLAMVVTAVALVAAFSFHDYRRDVSEGRVSSLSPDTIKLLDRINPNSPVQIEAYISARIPEEYMQTQYDLKTILKEFASRSPNVKVRIHDDLEPFDQQAVLAEQRFGITARPVRVTSRGAIRDEEVILGAAITSGLEKVTIPFFERGVPVEYELIRSINTVADQRRLKLGMVRTDAQLFATPTFQGGEFATVPQQMIVDELQKQYEVEQIDATEPITEGRFDVLMVVQPSSLAPEAMDNVIKAIQSGQPTLIFEDPLPMFLAAPGTGDPRRNPAQMMGMMGQPPPPKADIQKLWDAIGVEVPAAPGGMMGMTPDLAWQSFNPYPKLRQMTNLPDTWIFASTESEGGEGALNQKHPITSRLNEVLLMAPGVVRAKKDSDFEYTKLVSTGSNAGTIAYQKYREVINDPQSLQLLQDPEGPQTLAMLITGGPDQTQGPLVEAEEADDAQADEGKGEEEDDQEAGRVNENKAEGVNVLYVSDIDLMASVIFQIRNNPAEDAEQIQWNFENVTFLLNAIDYMAGETDYISIRKHRPKHFTLQLVEEQVESALSEEMEQQMKFRDDFEAALASAKQDMQKAVAEYKKRKEDLDRKRQQGEEVGIDEQQAVAVNLQAQEELAAKRLLKKEKDLQRERERNMKAIRRSRELKIDAIQNKYKMLALFIPPIPPMLVGIGVFAKRRLREREGIARTRLVK